MKLNRDIVLSAALAVYDWELRQTAGNPDKASELAIQAGEAFATLFEGKYPAPVAKPAVSKSSADDKPPKGKEPPA